MPETQTYDLDDLRAKVGAMSPGTWTPNLGGYETDAPRGFIEPEASELSVDDVGLCALLNAARAGLLDDAALGRAAPALVDMLKECARQFRFYAEQHKAKGTPEADEKARVNTDFAVRIANLLHSDHARQSGVDRAAKLLAIGLAVEAAAERDGPERRAVRDAIADADPFSSGIMYEPEAVAAVRALVAMQEGR